MVIKANQPNNKKLNKTNKTPKVTILTADKIDFKLKMVKMTKKVSI